MGESTKISWTDHTASPWHGCAKVSPGCDNCYAAAGARRNPKTLGVWGRDGTRVTSKSYADKLRRWDDAAAKAGVKRRVFPSICDPFEDFPGLSEQREKLWPLLIGTPNLIHLLLTKRPENVLRMVPPGWVKYPSGWLTDGGGAWPKNVWVGTTAEDQKRADERIPRLLDVPARVRFLSVEPQLERVELDRLAWWPCAFCSHRGGCHCQCPGMNNGVTVYHRRGVEWVIQGGESGHNARPFDLAWARDLRDQCKKAAAAYYFKQTGSNVVRALESDVCGNGTDPAWWPEDLRVQELPSDR